MQGRWKLENCPPDDRNDLVEADRREVRRRSYQCAESTSHAHVCAGPGLSPTCGRLRSADPSPGRSIRYSCGVQDPIISQVAQTVLSEMMHPTAAGRMLVETSSLFLAARLAHSYLETTFAPPQARGCHGLNARRLKRVLEYVDMHLIDDVTVGDLAKVACLSVFHFSRAFAASMGVPPHRYVSQRRLDYAKAMIVTGRTPLDKIASDTRFASQSSFTRAFRRATGMTPGEYRQASRQ